MEESYHRLITQYFDKTISDDGLTQLQEWIEQHPDNLAEFSDTITILEAAKASLKTPDNSLKVWAEISAHISQTETPKIKRRDKVAWLAYAASLLVLCTAGWFGYKYTTQNRGASAFEVVSNPNGKRSKLVLPDSSVVYLAGGSTLRYAKNFNGDKRSLILNGEAFFDVVHKQNKPFVVQTGSISTVVLGTSFNIQAYGADKKVTVTVATGKVGVMADVKGKNRLVKYLLPNEQININTQNGLFAFNKANAEQASAWINNNLVFYNTTFNDIVKSLERQYGVSIEFTEADLGSVRLTAKLTNLSLHQAMDNLTVLSGLAYTQNGNHLFISNANQKGGQIMK
ncbi:MAG: FecR domain-containing protein [Bacteroidota bacterium]